MAFVPFASWNSRSITHLANYLSRSLPMNSSDESFSCARHFSCPLLDVLDLASGPSGSCPVSAEFPPPPARPANSMEGRSSRFAGAVQLDGPAPHRWFRTVYVLPL